MNPLKEIIKEMGEKGTLEEKAFVNRFVKQGEDEKVLALSKTLVQNLYGEGYTPAQIEGFLLFTIRTCKFQNPKA